MIFGLIRHLDLGFPSSFGIWASSFTPMRLGIFGGTFDPIHYGHLLLAECCREQCRLDAVWFLPTAVPPHKQQRVLTPAPQRIEMLELAIAGNSAVQGAHQYAHKLITTRRAASALAESFLSPLPTHRDAASAAASVVRTSSIARLRSGARS